MRLRRGRTANSLMQLSRFERQHPPSSCVRASRESTLPHKAFALRATAFPSRPQKAFALRARNSSFKKLSRFARETPPSKSFRASREKLLPQKAFALRAKLTPLVRKLIVFAGRSRRPATPGIPALPSPFRIHSDLLRSLYRSVAIYRGGAAEKGFVTEKSSIYKKEPKEPIFCSGQLEPTWRGGAGNGRGTNI